MPKELEGFIVDDAAKRCRNCNSAMPNRAKYCSQCGQKDYTGRIKLRTILMEVLETIFNIENKTIKTLGALFIPGKLTTEFFKGRHQTYFRPLRLFLIMAIVHFAVIAFVVDNASEEALEKMKLASYSNAYHLTFLHELDSISQDIVPYYDDRNKKVQQALDSIKIRISKSVSDSMGIQYLHFPEDGGINLTTLKMSSEDVFTTPIQQILPKYEVEGLWPRFTLSQAIRVQRNLENLVSLVIGNLTWMILLMMPALALILKILYVRRKYYYVEHLIFSFHYHAFAFLVASPAYLLQETWVGAIPVAFGIILIYLFIAMKRVYKQGIFKTSLKFIALNNLYLFVFTLFLIFMLIISALVI
jgi:hypothetical protein